MLSPLGGEEEKSTHILPMIAGWPGMSRHPPFSGIDDRVDGNLTSQRIKANSKETRLASDGLRIELGEG